jgi:cytidylate kinase
MIIAIDGPAGTGKSTVARKLAAHLGLPCLDTGAMYRVVTLAALDAGADLRDEEALRRLAADSDYQLDCGPTYARVTLRGRDVTEEIRSMRVSENTRFIAASPGVRRILVERQRAIGRDLGSMVTEGRDQGSVAFPDAAFKFFLDAEVEKRAERRYHELLADGQEVTLEQVRANLEERDRIDSQRPVAPLVEAPGAVRIDTTRLSLHDVLARILDHLARAGVVAGAAPTASKPTTSAASFRGPRRSPPA